MVSLIPWDTTPRLSLKALCAAQISNLVAAVANGPAVGIATTSDTCLHLLAFGGYQTPHAFASSLGIAQV